MAVFLMNGKPYEASRYRLHVLALAHEHRPDTGGRVSSAVFYRDGQQVVAATGDWQMNSLFARLAIEAAA